MQQVTDEPQKYLLSNRNQTQKKTYCDFIYMKFLEKAKLDRKEADQQCQGEGHMEIEQTAQRDFLGWSNVLKLDRGEDYILLYKFTKLKLCTYSG